MGILYFGYGSNLCTQRLEARVSGVTLVTRAWLNGYELRWNKRGKDGSGKCSISVSEQSDTVVHGAVFSLSDDQKGRLDRVEGVGFGYNEIGVVVESGDGPRSAVTYIARAAHIDDSLGPYRWYRDLVISGAEALLLPADYIDGLRGVVGHDDPDPEREARNRRVLPCRGSA